MKKILQIVVESVKTGNKNAVSTAIKHGADVIPWLITSMPGDRNDMLQMPVENDISCTLLGLAAEHGHHNLINCLLKAGVDIDNPGGSNRAPLHVAIERNDVEFARKLIQSGADIEATTNETAGI